MRLDPARSFTGDFRLPGDKSVSHRLAILGAMARGETRIQGFSTAADCATTLSCLEGLGVTVHREGSQVTVVGRGLRGFDAPAGDLDAGNSGSTLRILAGVLAGRPFRSVLTGDASLRRRPVERVALPLRAMGATVASTDGRPPLTIEGGALRGIRWAPEVPSAQVKTAVLLAGLQAQGRTTVIEPVLSRDHTERLLPVFGVAVEREGLAASVDGGAELSGIDAEVPGDPSSSAFLVVAALIIPDSRIRIENVLLNPTRTAFLDVLRSMGGRIATGLDRESPEPVGWIEAETSRLGGTTIPPSVVPALIDEIPALMVAAAFGRGTTTVTGASELRIKESDRIAALAEGLTRMGVDLTEYPDGLAVHGGRPLRGATLSSHDDHRIAMALSIAALAARGESHIEDADCVAVSFPEFYRVLERGVGRG